MPLASGERLGPYEILEPIGAGGMGEVYKARDTRLDRVVAVKVSNERFSERFRLEAKAVAALNHPNICTLHDVGPNYLVMEYIEGESPKGPMPLDEALGIARQIADALEAAHDAGITHRDLKPANIRIKPDGTVKVLDFGLAKVTLGTSASGENSPTFAATGITEIGMILGTAAYMAPEQARGKAIDKRVDIFAFGVVLYELTTGRRLFDGEDVGEMLARVIRDEPDLSAAPPAIQRLLAETLRKDPRKRLRDIGDVWRLLDTLPAPAIAAPASPAGKQPHRANWIWPVFAAVVILAAGIPELLHWRQKPPAPEAVRFEISPPPKTALNSFTVSPDGRKLVMNVRNASGRNTLWLRQMDSLQPRELAGTEGARLDPVWSPDSQFIAFEANGNLKKIDITNGAPQTLAPYTSVATGIAWSKQDVILFGSNGVINRVPAAGGEVTALTVMDPHGEQAQGRPFFLPDGKHFLYFRLKDPGAGIYVGSLDTRPMAQDPNRLLDSPAGVIYTAAPAGDSGHLFFLRGQSLMAQPFDTKSIALTGRAVQLADRVSTISLNGLFSVSNTGILAYAVTGGDKRQLAWYDRQGKNLGRAGEPSARDEMALSPDGTRVAEGRMDERGTWGVWMLDLARGVNTRLSFEAGGGNGVWSPDGKEIIYAPGGGQSADLYRKPANGAGQQELLFHSDANKTPLDWSRDGRYLLFTQRGAKTGSDLWVLPMEGEHNPIPYLVTPFNEGQAQFSPDGRWVAYASNESGTKEVYVQPFPAAGGGKWAVSNGGGSQPHWRRDGKELFYFTPDQTLMFVSATVTGGMFQPGMPRALFRASVLGGTGGGPGLAWRYDVAPDGQRFLMNTTLDEETGTPITAILNWQSAVK
jgi:eukaryotic-like serine/threonine-protein kinase